MKNTTYLWVIVGVLLIVIILLVVQVSGLNRDIRSAGEEHQRTIAELREEIKRVQADVEAAKELAPELSEYMLTLQLHAAKLWYAARAANWELAAYQLHELEETMEAAKKLNAEEKRVKISDVLDAVVRTQIAQLAETIEQKNAASFQKAYDETLSACNGCHTETGHRFIQIVRPTAPPVTNQRWEMGAK